MVYFKNIRFSPRTALLFASPYKPHTKQYKGKIRISIYKRDRDKSITYWLIQTYEIFLFLFFLFSLQNEGISIENDENNYSEGMTLIRNI